MILSWLPNTTGFSERWSAVKWLSMSLPTGRSSCSRHHQHKSHPQSLRWKTRSSPEG